MILKHGHNRVSSKKILIKVRPENQAFDHIQNVMLTPDVSSARGVNKDKNLINTTLTPDSNTNFNNQPHDNQFEY